MKRHQVLDLQPPNRLRPALSKILAFRCHGGADEGSTSEASGLSLPSRRASVDRMGSHQILQGCAGGRSLSQRSNLFIQRLSSTRWSQRCQFHLPPPYCDSAVQEARIAVPSACLGQFLLRLHQSATLRPRVCVCGIASRSTIPGIPMAAWLRRASLSMFERVWRSATVLLQFGSLLTHASHTF